MEDRDYGQHLTTRTHDFDHDAKGVIWVNIYKHIYKLRFTPPNNFYQPELDHVLNNQDNHLLPFLLPLFFF